MITGLPPSNFEYGVSGSIVMRFYLLDSGDHVVGIEVDDVSGSSHLASYDLVIKSFRFGPD